MGNIRENKAFEQKREADWVLAKEIAEKMVAGGFTKADIEGMDKFEMAKRFDAERVKNMPDCQTLDGRFDEEDCFDYFLNLLNLQFALQKRRVM